MRDFYVDVDLLFEVAENTFRADEVICRQLAIHLQQNPDAKLHFFFDDEHQPEVSKESDEFITLFLSSLKKRRIPTNTRDLSEKLNALKLLPACSENSFIHAARLLRKPLNKEWLLISSKVHFQDCFLGHVLTITKPEKETVVSRKLEFIPHPKQFEYAVAAAQNTRDLKIKLLFDLDDTILKFRDSVDSNCIVINTFLVESTAKLLNSLDTLLHVECFVVSARPDDKVIESLSLKAKSAVDEFVVAVNEKIKEKHPAGINFLNIFCLKSGFYTGKKIVTITEKTSHRAVVARRLMASSEKHKHDSNLHDMHEVELIWDSSRNKSVFLKYFLIPEMENVTVNFLAIFFDDNQEQLSAIGALGDSRFHCVEIIRPENMRYLVSPNPNVMMPPPRLNTSKTSKSRVSCKFGCTML